MSNEAEKTATQKTNEKASREERLKRRAQRQQKLDNSEPWEPEPGDSLMGNIFGWQKREHKKWGVWYKVFLKDEEGNIHGLPTFHGVLQTEFNRVDASVGDMVVIIYNGKVEPDEGEEGNPYHNYTVVSENEDMDGEDGALPFEEPHMEGN